MRQPAILFIVLLLAACGGGGGGTGAGTSPDAPDQAGDAVTLEMAATTADVVSGGPPAAGAPAERTPMGVEFLADETVARVTVAGIGQFLEFDGINQYASPDGARILAFSHGPVDGAFGDRQMVGMLYRDPDGAYPRVFGNETAAADLPRAGSASYAGYGIAWTGGLGTTTPVLDLTANFAVGTIGGTVRQAIFGAPGETLALDPVGITGAGFSGPLRATGGIALAYGEMSGRFYDPSGGSLGGTLIAVTPFGTTSGYWLTERQ